MVLFDLEQMEQYEQLSRDMNTRGKLEVLAMFNNRFLKMKMKAEYVNDQGAQRVIEDLSKFLQPIIFDELVHLGELAQLSYSAVSNTWDLKTVLQIETEHDRLHQEKG